MSEPISFLTAWPDFLTGQRGKPVRVILLSSDVFLHQAVMQEFDKDLRVELVATGTSMAEGRRLLGASKFDAVIVDLLFDDGDSFELIGLAKRVHENCEVIAVSTAEDESKVMRALQLGATGFLIKNAPFQNYSLAVLQVVNGGAAITPRLARRLFSRMDVIRPADTPPFASKGSGLLSARELEILKLISSGHASETIGSILLISTQTVNSHVKNIYKKFDVHSRAHAVSFATSRGII